MKKGVLRNFLKFIGKYLCQSLFFNKAAAQAATRGVQGKRLFLEISQNSQENACARVPFLNEVAGFD